MNTNNKKKPFTKVLSATLAAAVISTLVTFTPAALASGGQWTDFAAAGFAAGNGSGSNPYQIGTPEQLAYLAVQVNTGSDYKDKYFIQTDNIDLAGHEWVPIGQNSGVNLVGTFAGSYDGGNFEISNMEINSIKHEDVGHATRYAGFFGAVNHTYGEVSGFDKYIKNIKLTNIAIDITLAEDKQAEIGGLFAEYCGNQSAVTNCSVSGSLNLKQSGYNKNIVVGGFVGDINSTLRTSSSATFDTCFADVDITTWSEETGGFAGNISACTTIKNCAAVGNVTVDTGHVKKGRNPYVGGFIGYSFGQSGNSADAAIKNCYAMGDVVCKTVEDTAYIGGFGGGFDYGVSISNSYASGKVAFTGLNDNTMALAGGFSGGLLSGTVKNCYAAGNIDMLGGDYAIGGGFVGALDTEADHCFASGNVNASNADTMNRAFGFSGNTSAGATVTNCGAFGEKITANTVSPFLSSSTSLMNSDNFYYGGMDFNGVVPVSNHAGGTAVTAGEIQNGPVFSGWDRDIWKVGTYALPVLKAIPENVQILKSPQYLNTFGISLSSSGDKNFGPTPYGYETQTPYSVTANNVGNQPTGTLAITLSGQDAGSFMLSQASMATIAASGSANFTVVPKTGLAVGRYAAIVTVTGENDISEHFNVDFTVEKADPGLKAPNGIAATYGDMLANVTLPEGWTWNEAGTTPVGAAGGQLHKATYTPEDTDNYFMLTDMDVYINVQRKAVTVTAENKEKIFGAADPLLTWNVNPALIDGDTLTGSLKYTGLTVGNYDIVEDTPFDNPNYDITFVKGTMTINSVSVITAAKPTSSKKSGIYTGSVKVTLKSATPGAKICYTLDGKTPTGKSKSITSGKTVTVSKTATLKFMAVAAGCENSEIGSVLYKIKTDKPNHKAVLKSKKLKKGTIIKLKAPKEVTLYYIVNSKKNPSVKTKTKVKPGRTVKIKITKTTTLKVIAKKEGCLASNAANRKYTVK